MPPTDRKQRPESKEPRGESRTARAAIGKVESLDLPLPAKPRATVEWPENLSDLLPDELAEQLTYWAGYVAYVGFQVALMDVERKAYETQGNVARTKAFLGAPSDKVTDKREIANGSKDVLEALERYVAFDAQYRLLAALFAGYEAKYAAASRELTRREQAQGRA